LDWKCCWNNEHLEMGDCPNIAEGEEDLLHAHHRRILEKCCDCPDFVHDLALFNQSEHPLAPAFQLIFNDFQRQKTHIQSLASFLDSKTLEVRFLHELGSVLQSSLDLEEVLSVALTAITAGKGFGMNRAFLLLTDRDHGILKGYLGIGPRSYEEANNAWEEISRNDLDLQALAQSFRINKLNSERAKFHDILENLTIPLSQSDHIIVQALNSKQPLLVENAFQNPNVPLDLAQLLGVDTFLIMPLIARNRRVGVILADNCITRHHISEEDMRSLETFTFPVAVAIERASLYDRLQIELNRVTEANSKLKEQQELIVKMEKMALVGRITSSIAHSIRNPLMVIGGFARSILKSTSKDDPKLNYIESIIKESRQLEEVLDEILNYSDSLYPTKDFWNVNHLLDNSFKDIHDLLQRNNCQLLFEPQNNISNVYIDFKQVSYCIRTLISSDLSGQMDTTISVDLEEQDKKVIVTIIDNSRMVSQDELNSLLTPFETTQGLAEGFGLALCKTMLKKQGIPFTVTALPERGVSCKLELPTLKEERNEQNLNC
jgi:signal transduction histidine kinase